VVAFNERSSKISSQNKIAENCNKFITFQSSLQSKTNFPEKPRKPTKKADDEPKVKNQMVKSLV
jgi:hypothetical protein